MSGYKMDLALIEKENRAFDLHIQEGKTFDTIAKEIGYSTRSGAHKAFLRAKERFTVGDRKERIETEVQRLESLMEVFFAAARQGNLEALDAVLKIMTQKLNYLKLDEPINIKAEVVNYEGLTGLDAEVIEIARVIDYIEGISADITTVADKSSEGEQADMAAPSENGTTTA